MDDEISENNYEKQFFFLNFTQQRPLHTLQKSALKKCGRKHKPITNLLRHADTLCSII